MWIARNKNGKLFLYMNNKPNRKDIEYNSDLDDHDYTGCWIGSNNDNIIELDSKLFENLKWEDEPFEVEFIEKSTKDFLIQLANWVAVHLTHKVTKF